MRFSCFHIHENKKLGGTVTGYRGIETMDKVLLVIPAYNEEKNIERVVDHIKNDFPELDYVVVNDGSKDDTAAICRRRGYNFIDLPVNLGLAGCFQTGMKYA